MERRKFFSGSAMYPMHRLFDIRTRLAVQSSFSQVLRWKWIY
jgi:hypothetical protein